MGVLDPFWPSCEPSWDYLGCLGAILGCSGRIFGGFRALWGPSVAEDCGRSKILIFQLFFADFGRPHSCFAVFFGAVRGRRGANSNPLEAILKLSWQFLTSCGVSASSEAALALSEVVLSRLGALPGRLGALLDRFGAIWRRPGGFRGWVGPLGIGPGSSPPNRLDWTPRGGFRGRKTFHTPREPEGVGEFQWLFVALGPSASPSGFLYH